MKPSSLPINLHQLNTVRTNNTVDVLKCGCYKTFFRLVNVSVNTEFELK